MCIRDSWEPNRGWNTSRNEPVAGEYQAYALDLQGVSPGQVEQLKQSLEATQTNIETENYDALTKQGLVGDTLYATMLSYMALNNLQDSIQSKSAGMISYRAPSYGQFKTKVTPQYWYGVPRMLISTVVSLLASPMTTSLENYESGISVR